MATTKEQLDQLTNSGPETDRQAVALEAARILTPEVPPQPAAATAQRSVAAARARLARRLEEPITPRWALIGAVAWVVLLGVGIAVEPPPTDPNAVDPWFVSALGTILLVALLGTVAGLWLRRRWSLAASLVAAGLLLVSTVLCPISGHHAGVAEAVNLYEAPASGNYWAASCVSGWLIQATVDRAGGWGRLRTNRSG
jgi:hypothetical protein